MTLPSLVYPSLLQELPQRLLKIFKKQNKTTKSNQVICLGIF